MTDNQAPDQTTQINTTFLEERSTNIEEASTAVPMKIPRQMESEFGEDVWYARNQLMKPVQVGQYSWLTTTAQGAMLASFDFPEILVKTESLMKRTLSMYAFFKMTPVMRFQLNSTTFHQGQLIISFDPFIQATDGLPTDVLGSSQPFCNLIYVSGLPNVKIMASESEASELEIPFIHPRNYLTTNSSTGFDIMGRVRVHVLNRLLITGGCSNECTLTAWVYARDAEVHVPMNYHDLKIPVYSPPFERAEATSGFADSVMGVVSNVKKTFGNAMTGNYGQAMRDGGNAVDSIKGALGLDYPTYPISASKTISPVENLAVCRGASRSHRLGVDPKAMHMLPSGVVEDHSLSMDILRIARTPMLLDQWEWRSTQATHTQLGVALPVSPTLQPYFNRTIALERIRWYQPSYLAFVAMHFGYWRGGITFDFEVVATKFQSGKLVVGYKPNNDTSITYEDIVTALPSATFDIQQTSKFSVTVPFTSPTGYKSTRNPQGVYIDESLTGYLYCFVQNRLTCAPNTSGTVYVNVYIRGAEDIQFAVPRASSIQQRVELIIPTRAEELAEPTSGPAIELQTDRSKDSKTSNAVVLSHGSGLVKGVARFGEEYNLIDLLKRFTIFNDDFTDVSKITNISVSPLSAYADTTVGQNDTNNLSYLASWSSIYSAWTGALRYKFIIPASRTNRSMLSVWHVFDSPFELELDDSKIDQREGYATALTTLSQDNTLEIEVPYYSMYNMLLLRHSGTDTADNYWKTPTYNGSLRFETVGSGETDSVSIWLAAGDDFRFIYLRSPPANGNWQYNHIPYITSQIPIV
ncbi:coat protein [Erysiphe necator associated picorna-like virus 3]|nr:coat protein [Erysiphe necator associated picorna-like virus 3]